MATTDLAKMLEEALEPVAHANGYELVAVEQAGGRHTPIIRVLLDRESGVDLDAISEANLWVCAAIDELDPIAGPYTLEVSSPGIDRPLRKLADFARFAGERVHIKVRPAVEGHSSVSGTLKGLDGDDVIVETDDGLVRVPFSSGNKARLKGTVSFNRERGAE